MIFFRNARVGRFARSGPHDLEPFAYYKRYKEPNPLQRISKLPPLSPVDGFRLEQVSHTSVCLIVLEGLTLVEISSTYKMAHSLKLWGFAFSSIQSAFLD
jgi:hypothetical protein